MPTPVPASVPVTRGEILMHLGGDASYDAYGVTMIEGYRMFLKQLTDNTGVDKVLVVGEIPSLGSIPQPDAQPTS